MRVRPRPLLPLLAAALVAAGCGGSGGGDDPAARTTTAPPGKSRPHRSTLDQKLASAALQRSAVEHYVHVGLPIFCGGRHERLVALTFDDGPGPYTKLALKQMRRYHAHATFFLVADSIARAPSRVRREVQFGAAMGEHTATHANLPALAPAAADAEITGGRVAAEHAGAGKVRLFRPPYGAHDAHVDSEVRRQGMAQILWDVDSEDSETGTPRDFHDIAGIVRRDVRPGSIVLLHENRGQTIRALRSILPMLKRRGLRTVTVPELLAADPPSRRQLERGADGCDVRADKNHS